jgi:hypothetical protein
VIIYFLNMKNNITFAETGFVIVTCDHPIPHPQRSEYARRSGQSLGLRPRRQESVRF